MSKLIKEKQLLRSHSLKPKTKDKFNHLLADLLSPTTPQYQFQSTIFKPKPHETAIDTKFSFDENTKHSRNINTIKFTKTSINLRNNENIKPNKINLKTSIITTFIKNKPDNKLKASFIETKSKSRNALPTVSKSLVNNRNDLKEMINLYKRTGLFINMKKRSNK